MCSVESMVRPTIGRPTAEQATQVLRHDHLTQRCGAASRKADMRQALLQALLLTSLYSFDEMSPLFRRAEMQFTWLNDVPLLQRQRTCRQPLGGHEGVNTPDLKPEPRQDAVACDTPVKQTWNAQLVAKTAIGEVAAVIDRRIIALAMSLLRKFVLNRRLVRNPGPASSYFQELRVRECLREESELLCRPHLGSSDRLA